MKAGWAVCLIMAGLLGCAEGAKLVQDTGDGGVVTFLFKEERGGPVFSRYRQEAVAIMKKKCPDGYRIMKEGETRGSGAASAIEGAEDNVTRRWAFQFRCTSI